MEHRLTGILTAIRHHAIGRDPQFLRDGSNLLIDICHDGSIVRRQCGRTGDVLLRNDQKMRRRRRSNVIKRQNLIVLIDLV